MTGHRVHHVGLGALWDYCGACRRTGHVEYCRCGSVRVRRTPRHRVTCHDCPLVIHSDQAGSRNIVRQKTPAMAWDADETPLWPETHRWSGQQWVDVKHPPASVVGDRVA